MKKEKIKKVLRKGFFPKTLRVIISSVFIVSQIIPLAWADSPLSVAEPLGQTRTFSSGISLQDTSGDTIPSSSSPFSTFQTTQDFLQDDSPLSLADSSSSTDIFLSSERRSSALNIETADPVPLDDPGQPLTLRDHLIHLGQAYFNSGVGVNPETLLPYDRLDMEGNVVEGGMVVQPTLVGFYAQMLGDVVSGATEWEGKTVDDALVDLDGLVGSLLDVQAQSLQEGWGWGGLIPWLDIVDTGGRTTLIKPHRGGDGKVIVPLGDNANLSQSLAVTIGSVEGATLTEPQQVTADSVVGNTETYLENQTQGYQSFVMEDGRLAQVVDPEARDGRSLGLFGENRMDRLGNEFRGAIAFLKVRYDLPESVWDELEIVERNYTSESGETIENLAAWDGGAFQIFWPLLRNDELAYESFQNLHYNHLVSQTDFAAQNRTPGIISASDVPGGGYEGKSGIPEIAETVDPLLSDVGSTYALASAYNVDPKSVMNWMNAIDEQLPEMQGLFGFRDSARSASEMTDEYLGIDVASSVLGLTGAGPSAFQTYLENRELNGAYDELYQRTSDKIEIAKTSLEVPAPPLFPDQSLSTFSHLLEGNNQWSLGAYSLPQYNNAAQRWERDGVPMSWDEASVFFPDHRGVYVEYGSFSGQGGWGGLMWNLDESYDARDNEMMIEFDQIVDTPLWLKFELKNSNDVRIHKEWVKVPAGVSNVVKTISLPDDFSYSDVKSVVMVMDQNVITEDRSGEYSVKRVFFRHFPDEVPAS